LGVRSVLILVALAVLAGASPAAAAVADRTFGSGTFRVGPGGIAPGTYRAPGGEGCYFERLRSFSGSLNAILANGNPVGPIVVMILPTDKGFSTRDCGTWSRNLSPVTRSKTRFGNGTFIVGVDVLPGTYQTAGGEGCYWERLRSFVGTLDAIIANANPQGTAIVTIGRGDRGFESHDCGSWHRF
jgi:hypothetical protein